MLKKRLIKQKEIAKPKHKIMKAIYKLNFDCGRMGELTGVFVADTEKVRVLVDQQIEVYFGEVLGNHSEIYGPVSDKEIVMVSDSKDAVDLVESLKLQTGFNPFNETAVNFKLNGEDTEDMLIDEICDKLIESSLNS